MKGSHLIGAVCTYVFLLVSTSPNAAPITYQGDITFGSTVTGTLIGGNGWSAENELGREWWTFSGREGDIVSITGSRLDGDLDLAFSLYFGTTEVDESLFSAFSDFGGMTFFEWYDDEWGPAIPGPERDPQVLGFWLPTTGTYSIAIESNGNGPACGACDYELTVALDPNAPVDFSGIVRDPRGAGLCAMVLASGQYTFSCNQNQLGFFFLLGLPRENNGTVKRQIYAHGFLPNIEVLQDSDSHSGVVVMERAGTCPNYNSFSEPGAVPDSAGKRIDISGSVLLQDTQTPICAMVLANGQYMFSCDGTGSYALNIPLDNNGQYKLQVYADGFAPVIQTFDEFQATNDVRMARATECQ